ncbi:carbohydrate ABC transporter permease [Ruminiclostridium herbifermentans]|uniref:carbohydrate ABC transporter permease n=1 Tax=Ruminiclostridium herbifermentans TaxID=2488810 RepID=UPI001FD433EA|nr:carbohydrate ABC transporter permease [Ruminiclostridium herbifermentans]
MQYLFGISGGFVLAKFRFKFKDVLYYIIILCMIIPFSVIVLPQYMLFKNLGIFDSVLAIILPGGYGAMGFFFYCQFIKQIPNDILEAGQIDGASPLVLLKKILAPMLKDCSLAYLVICFCTNWNAIDPAIAFIRTTDIQPLSIALKEAFINAPEVFFAPAVLYMIPPVLVYLFFSEELVRGLSFEISIMKGASNET